MIQVSDHDPLVFWFVFVILIFLFIYLVFVFSVKRYGYFSYFPGKYIL